MFSLPFSLSFSFLILKFKLCSLCYVHLSYRAKYRFPEHNVLGMWNICGVDPLSKDLQYLCNYLILIMAFGQATYTSYLHTVLTHGPRSFIRRNVILPYKPQWYINLNSEFFNVDHHLSNPKNYIFWNNCQAPLPRISSGLKLLLINSRKYSRNLNQDFVEEKMNWCHVTSGHHKFSSGECHHSILTWSIPGKEFQMSFRCHLKKKP